MVEAPSRQRSRTPRPGEAGRLQRLTAGPTTRDVRSALTWIVGLSILARLVLSTVAHAPVIFSDELGYVKLAESIGRTGHLGLFDHRGLSYSPLYPIVLAPVYALGVSAPTAYLLIKVVNAVLMSLAILPTYRIARFVLSQRDSVIVAALSALAPLMFYASFSMSENLAYPLCLCAIWAMLEATRSPGLRTDAVFLGAALLATAARVELVLLVPAALTAFLLAALLERQPDGPLRRVLAAVTRHGLLFGVAAAALAVAGAAALGGKGVFSVFGRYAEVGRIGLPGFDRFLTVLVRHVAELDLAVGVVPFVAAIVCAIALARRRFRGRALPFAAVATSLTVWLLAEIAYDGALYDGAGGELVRIHERWLIYVFPLFLVALLATVRVGRELVSNRVWLLAGAGAALLPLAIPFHTVINQASAVDTFGLQPLAHTKNGVVVPIPFVAAAAVAGAAVLCLLFVQVRGQTRATVLLVLIPLVFISGQVMSRVSSGSEFARSQLPARTDWVDAVKPRGTVVLLTAAPEPTSALETAYANLSIDRLFYLCRPAAGPEFGEQRATIDRLGTLRGPAGPIEAAYVVAPAGLGIRGTVAAINPEGRQVLIATRGRRVGVAPLLRSAVLACGR